jgi:hypothetical protein
MFDIYRHSKRQDLRLTTRLGSGLPHQASKSIWQPAGRVIAISQMEADEIQRSGYSIKRRHLPKDKY